MKKRMPKMRAFILTLLSVMIVTGCGEGFRIEVNQKPHDDISKAIYEAVGREKVYFQGKKSMDPDEPVIYEYLVYDYEDEKLLQNMVEAANTVMEEKKASDKIILTLWEKTTGGGYEAVASLHTYYENEDGCVQYGSFQTLIIQGTEHPDMPDCNPYDKVSTYINLPNIKSLTVCKKIAQSAEEEGIDWFEIWPDLEHYRVLEW